MSESQSIIARVARCVDSADSIAVLTGAGVSAESGIPTFRDAQTGIWARYDPMQLATPEAFAANPERVWNWYQWRRELVAGAAPSAAHRALAALERRLPAFTLITQNVDRLHQRAGSSAVVELHGNLEENRCSRENRVVAPAVADRRTPPRCPHCDALLRPNVVWFGETLPAEALERALTAARRCDLLLCIGTSGLVYPAAGLPAEALNRGATVVEINPQPTPLSPLATHCLQGRAGETLPRILELAGSGTKGDETTV